VAAAARFLPTAELVLVQAAWGRTQQMASAKAKAVREAAFRRVLMCSAPRMVETRRYSVVVAHPVGRLCFSAVGMSPEAVFQIRPFR
jgi:hypothetical protein